MDPTSGTRRDLVGGQPITDLQDTSFEVAQRYHEMLFARSPGERFIMGARMFDTARAMILASFPPDLSPDEVRRRLFKRLYPEIPPERIPEALR